MSEARRYNPDAFEREYITDQHRLIEVLPRLNADVAIGVDLEMAQRIERRPGGIQEWKQVLALIQVSTHSYSVVIDPVRVTDLSPLRGLMAGPVRKVFLGGGQDATLLDRAGIPASTIVDVGEIALSIFGRRQDGMAALAERIYGITLDKTLRRTDWLARPLHPVLIQYAHRDAELTLLIYDWFRSEYPEVTRLHERAELDPGLPPGSPLWLTEAVGKSSNDAVAIVMEHEMDPVRDVEILARDVDLALESGLAPRQVARLLRLAGELNLQALLPRVVPLTESPSSIIRAAAARAVGMLAVPAEGRPLLKRMREDSVDEVKRAADLGLRDLKAPRPSSAAPAETGETTSLSDGALSALQQLMAKLQSEGE